MIAFRMPVNLTVRSLSAFALSLMLLLGLSVKTNADEADAKR